MNHPPWCVNKFHSSLTAKLQHRRTWPWKLADVGIRILFVITITLTGLWSINWGISSHFPVVPIAKSDELVVAIVPYPGIYETRSLSYHRGFEYDLIRALARSRNLSVRFIEIDQLAELRVLLKLGQAHMAALRLPNGLGLTPFRTSHPYMTTRFSLITRQDFSVSKTLTNWLERRVIVTDASFSGWLRCQTIPGRFFHDWISLSSSWTTFERVNLRNFEATIADDQTFGLIRHRFPMLKRHLILLDKASIGFLFSSRLDEDSIALINNFIDQAKREGLIDRLIERHFGELNRLSVHDIELFTTRIETTLPHYLPIFLAAEEKTGLDWRLIAALAYQESHWDPDAISPTNVRGFMMLTTDTAKHLGVTDRNDIQQNVLAGARYLLMLRNKLPETMKEPQRTWMALAAYNLGFRALSTGRLLAETRQIDSRHWHKLKSVLGDLSGSKLVRERGITYARGGEAAIMVDRVRAFHRILCLHPKVKAGKAASQKKAHWQNQGPLPNDAGSL